MNIKRNKAIIYLAILGLLIAFISISLMDNEDNKVNTALEEADIEQQPKTESTKQEKEETYIYEDLGDYFIGYDGCFILYDSANDTYTIHNKEKSTKRLPPNSTFKIYNSLIGLESGIINDENTMFKWDGTKHRIEAWNRDHTLASAFSDSAVWYYKLLASQVGENAMQEYIDKIGYGNKDISGGIDKFWLQSSIKISPMEQVELLRKMYNYELPFAKENIDIVKKIMILSIEDDVVFRGKTGSGMKNNKSVNGWFVGYVEKAGKAYFFATNVEAEKDADGAHAKDITIRILRDKGIL